MASNGGSSVAMSLLDVAIRAAVQSGAPRRTVAATAAAVASVVMAEQSRLTRGDPMASTASASQLRRAKRKKARAKSAKEAADANADDNGRAEVDVTVGGNGDAPSPAAPVMHPSADLGPLPGPAAMPRTRCCYCAQDFPSRGRLFRALRETGHDKFFDMAAGDDISVGSRATSDFPVMFDAKVDRYVAAKGISSDDASKLKALFGELLASDSSDVTSGGSSSSAQITSAAAPLRAQQRGKSSSG